MYRQPQFFCTPLLSQQLCSVLSVAKNAHSQAPPQTSLITGSEDGPPRNLCFNKPWFTFMVENHCPTPQATPVLLGSRA